MQPSLITAEPAGSIATDFTQPVPDNGYAWWYVDGVSDDGQAAFTIIAFVGSVFSPYYAGARRKSAPAKVPADQHVAINAALYLPGGGKRWAMTERSQSALERSSQLFRVGPSHYEWINNELHISINERCMPFGQTLKGSIRLAAAPANQQGFSLHSNNKHHWQPIAPHTEVEVQFAQPNLSWTGSAYIDHNHGTAPLEEDFRYWSWSRQHLGTHTNIDYEIWQRDDSHRLASVGTAHNQLEPRQPNAFQELPKTGWRVARDTRVANARVERTLEDTPFYSRSVLTSTGDRPSSTVCESLDLNRFGSRWVQTLLPFRMPRVSR